MHTQPTTALLYAAAPKPRVTTFSSNVPLYISNNTNSNAHLPNTHRRRRRDLTVELSRVGGVHRIRNDAFGQTIEKKMKTEHVESYPVKLAAELETGSRLLTGEYTPPDTT